MEQSTKARIFLAIVGLASLFLFLTGPFVVIDYLTIFLVQIFGALLIIWALIAKKRSKKHTKHALPQGYFFVTQGPYEILRHPIYAGYILFMSSILEYVFTLPRIWAFLILILALVMKIIREETTMEEELKGEYREYQKKTKRIIPYVY